MKRALCFSLLFLSLMGYCSSVTKGSYYKWNDGGTHDLENMSWGSGRVSSHTTLNIKDNGRIESGALEVWDTSIVNIVGNGAYVPELRALSNSEINIANGTVGVFCTDFSCVKITGGQIRPASGFSPYLYAHRSAEMHIYGGQFSGVFTSDQSASIIFHGSDFKINGLAVTPGEYFASDFTSGLLTGKLDSGALLNHNFTISENASITLTPEPATLALLALGGLALLRRKRASQRKR